MPLTRLCSAVLFLEVDSLRKHNLEFPERLWQDALGGTREGRPSIIARLPASDEHTHTSNPPSNRNNIYRQDFLLLFFLPSIFMPHIHTNTTATSTATPRIPPRPPGYSTDRYIRALPPDFLPLAVALNPEFRLSVLLLVCLCASPGVLGRMVGEKDR
ncbi:hypothetical protein CBL_07953 [Carabus blaptoides fortunei]